MILISKNNNTASIFLRSVKDPKQYGSAYLDKNKKIKKIIENLKIIKVILP
jgi:dTDP-glucose pyrophosphorylase